MKLKFFIFLILFLINSSLYSEENTKPTSSLFIPFFSMSDVDNSFAIFTNPSSLSFMEGIEFLFLTTQITGKGAEGGGGYLTGNLFGPFAGGMGVEFLKSQNIKGTYVRLPVSFSLRWKKRLSFGFLYSWIYSEKDKEFDTISSLSLSLTLRPVDFLSFAFLLSDLNSPTFKNKRIERNYRTGIGIKPLKEFTLSFEIGVDENKKNFNTAGFLNIDAIKGIIFSLGFSAFPDLKPVEWFMGVFVSLSLGYASFLGGAVVSEENTISLKGATFGFKLFTQRESAIVEPENFLVEIPLIGKITEGKGNPFIFGKGIPFINIFSQIEEIGEDKRVKGVLLRIESLDLTWAQAEELRRLVNYLKKKGKIIVAYIDSADIKTYYLASISDYIFLDHGGLLLFSGISKTAIFIKQLLDKAGIKAQFYPVGKYKNFHEIFERTEASETAKEVLNSILTSIYEKFLKDVSESRKIEISFLKEQIEAGPYTSNEAKEKKLIDEIASRDEVIDKLIEISGKNFSLIRNYESIKVREKRWSDIEKIGVIPVIGTIIEGESGRIPLIDFGYSGDRTIISCIERMVRDPDVFGIIMRIDSSGGSAIASEKINRFLKKAKNYKPFVSIFGNSSASGAYYIASASQRIFSMETTLTGSIGIWGGKFSFEEFFLKSGITQTTTKKGESSDFLSPFRPFSEKEVEEMKEKLKYLYDLFVFRVAEGRGMKVNEVSKIAEGRVWTGEQAFERGLVDEIGGYYEAVKFLKEKNGIDEKEPVEFYFCPQLSLSEKLRSMIVPFEKDIMLSFNFFKEIAPYLIMNKNEIYAINPLILIEN